MRFRSTKSHFVVGSLAGNKGFDTHSCALLLTGLVELRGWCMLGTAAQTSPLNPTPMSTQQDLMFALTRAFDSFPTTIGPQQQQILASRLAQLNIASAQMRAHLMTSPTFWQIHQVQGALGRLVCLCITGNAQHTSRLFFAYAIHATTSVSVLTLLGRSLLHHVMLLKVTGILGY